MTPTQHIRRDVGTFRFWGEFVGYALVLGLAFGVWVALP